ncbi:MAG TPA: polymer-forming cytoskeletal protein [Vicinamibacterales bacterium]|jgi:cytoskeletal protein CcmA (bactofilin family)
MPAHSRGSAATRIPTGAIIEGGLEAAEDLIIDGSVDGYITLPNHHVSIGSSGKVSARIVARSVTISGFVDGNILARERIDLLQSAFVRGHLTTPAITVQDGARFTGTVDPHRTEAAMQVARYRERLKEEQRQC